MFKKMQVAVPWCQLCLPWVSVAEHCTPDVGLWPLRSWAEGALSQGVSHSLGFPSVLFPLQNSKTNSQNLPLPDRLNHLQAAPENLNNAHECAGQGFVGQLVCFGVSLGIP